MRKLLIAKLSIAIIPGMFDIKKKLQEYLPGLFELIGDNEIGWNRLTKIFLKNYSELEAEYDKGEQPVIRKKNIYSTINYALNGNQSEIDFRNFINCTFSNLAILLNKEERKLVCKNVKDFLLFGEDFLNYVAEVAILNNLMKTGTYRLIAVEAKSPNVRTKIDFKLKDEKKNTEVLVEVVSISIDDRIKRTDDNLTAHIQSKIREKLKLKNHSIQNDFILIPVIWYESPETLQRIISLCNANKFDIPGSYIPHAYSSVMLPNNKNELRFGRITTLLS